ncbi:MAG: hypothetical protein EOM41_01420, partial [Bacilli bacterium]|nr:hypothetical protein [Bacilli bacterium]
SLFIIGHMGLFFYTKKGSIISTVDLPTTEIIEPQKTVDDSLANSLYFYFYGFVKNCPSYMVIWLNKNRQQM